MFKSESKSTAEPERFLISPPNLKNLAAQEMSLIFYQQLVKDYRGIDIINEEWFIYRVYDPEDIIECPPVIANLIHDSVWNPVNVSIQKWCEYHAKYVFFDSSLHAGILNCIDDFVLKVDGSMNFRSTAQSILKNDKLDSVEKFRLACLYCLANDVRSLWPVVHDNPRITECKPEDNPMVQYWICVMKDQSPRFPGSNPDSFEGYLLVLECLEWESIEYFWSTLSADEQVVVAGKLLDRINNHDRSFIEPLFLRLNKIQFRRVMEDIEVGEILFASNFDGKWRSQEMFKIWNYIKFFISPATFREIIDVFVRDGFENSEIFCTFLFEIWTSAPDSLTCSFLSDFEAVKSIFRELHSETYNHGGMYTYHYDMRFFIAVLSELSFQSRNSLWHEFWYNLIVGASPKTLDHMMKLCFNNEDEITQFKERYMLNFDKIRSFCCLYVANGRVSHLNDYLDFCSSNIHYVMTVKRQIIRSKQIQAAFVKSMRNYELKLGLYHTPRGTAYSNFIDFDEFIDGSFFDARDAREYKKGLLASHADLQKVWQGVYKNRLGVSWL